MVAAVAQVDYAKLLFRTEPFSKMASARRFQLLSQARSVRFESGDHVFAKGQPPVDVLLLLGGTVVMLADMPGHDEAVVIGEYGPGSCVGWDVALADVCGVEAVAVGEVVGLLVSAPSFIEIARFEPALRDSFLFRPSNGEVWWAIMSELQRRDLPMSKADSVVAKISSVCTTRDWPDEEAAIQSKTNYIWVVSGGEGVFPGTTWEDTTGVLWARLIGIPMEQFYRALDGEEIVSEEPPQPKTLVQSAPEKSPATPDLVSAERSPSRGKAVIAFLRATAYLAVIVAAVAAGLCGWASRQPTIEKMATEGRLVFSGDVHEVSATVAGKLTESKLRVGQRVGKGAVLAIIKPPRDDAKVSALSETFARAKVHVDVCERILAGSTVRPNEAPEAISSYVRELNALKSEYRIKNAIHAGRTDDRSLTVEERAKVNAHFDMLKADRAARVDSAQTDSSIKREDLADAEQSLREAKEDLRLQTEAAAALLGERGDEAKAEAASAQRAIGIYKRTVAARLDGVTRIRKEIAAIRVAPAVVAPVAAPQKLDGIAAAIAEIEKSIRKFSASMRILAVETEVAIDQINADSAPRQITALYPGLVVQTELVAPEAPVGPATVLGKMVTRQAWEIECPDQSVRFLKSGQEVTIVAPTSDGSLSRISAQYSRTLPGASKGKARICHGASNDEWREGTPVKVEAMVVTGNLLDRWLAQVGMIRP